MAYLFSIKNLGDVKVYCDAQFAPFVKELLELCRKNQSFCQLLQLIQRIYPDFSIAFGDTKLFYNACWRIDTHQIQIKQTQKSLENYLEALTFECCNAINPGFRNKNASVNHFVDAEQYAIYMETSEYNSFKLAQYIYMDGIKNAGWPEPKDKDLIELSSLNKWMERVKTETNPNGNVKSHFNYYVNFFNQQKLKESQQDNSNRLCHPERSEGSYSKLRSNG